VLATIGGNDQITALPHLDPAPFHADPKPFAGGSPPTSEARPAGAEPPVGQIIPVRRAYATAWERLRSLSRWVSP
jgi:hypothetical protein